MCCLTVKKDSSLSPHWVKNRIIDLGNPKERAWSKSKRFVFILSYDPLWVITSIVVNNRRCLGQGIIENEFCNATLPSDKVTIVKPPIGCPISADEDYWLLHKIFYSLWRSPRH